MKLSTLGERGVLDRLTRGLPSRPDVVVGVGDDCAVVRIGADDYLLTSDPVVEGVHFTSGAAPEAIGHKAVGRVLSDIAAMGGLPLWLLIDVAAPPELPVEWLERIYGGATTLCRRHGAAIIGGDLSTGTEFSLHVFGVGRVPAGTARLRSTATAGDRIYVTGCLGGSAAGRHLCFEPRLAEGCWLRERQVARAMMDVSDGLLLDLDRMMAASGTGADLRLDHLPVSPEAASASDGRSGVEHALGDGEDFELLFTVSADQGTDWEAEWARVFATPCTCIGRVQALGGVLRGLAADGSVVPLEARGFEHYRRGTLGAGP